MPFLWINAPATPKRIRWVWNLLCNGRTSRDPAETCRTQPQSPNKQALVHHMVFYLAEEQAISGNALSDTLCNRVVLCSRSRDLPPLLQPERHVSGTLLALGTTQCCLTHRFVFFRDILRAASRQRQIRDRSASRHRIRKY